MGSCVCVCAGLGMGSCVCVFAGLGMGSCVCVCMGFRIRDGFRVSSLVSSLALI